MIGLLLCLAACAPSRALGLEQSLHAYHSAIRWGSMQEALTLVDPAYLAKNPVNTMEWERYKQIRIVGYRPGDAISLADGTVEQRVEIEFANLHTQATRTILDRQVWRYDEPNKRWWLTTGLPRMN